jgi:hypothetical protein
VKGGKRGDLKDRFNPLDQSFSECGEHTVSATATGMEKHRKEGVAMRRS